MASCYPCCPVRRVCHLRPQGPFGVSTVLNPGHGGGIGAEEEGGGLRGGGGSPSNSDNCPLKGFSNLFGPIFAGGRWMAAVDSWC